MAFVKTYDGSEPVRINKWLGQSGVCSRREAEALIAAGQVSIDGVTITDAGHKISAGQTLTLNDAAQTQLETQLSLIYHKPIGIVSGQPEPGETPAVRMIKRSNLWRLKNQPQPETYPDQTSKLAPIGRLDKDSRGLLILSEDGVLAKAVIGPESELDKEYIVRVRGAITDEKLKLLRHGLELDGRRLRPAKVKRTAEQTLNFILTEGRNRQIRRMCDLVELRVIDLVRIRIGPITLGELPEGQWRPLTPDERTSLVTLGR